MTGSIKIKDIKPITIWYYTFGAICLWSIFIASVMFWNFKTEKSGINEAAKIQAREAIEKDIMYRRWNAEHGGLYALVTKNTQPNPYLEVKERDIETSSGRKLTKINPAFMTRQVHELAREQYGIKGHITSLKPIRPSNAPDKWEARELKAFEKGKKEASSVEIINSKRYVRVMRPLVTEESCLKCHSKQGYKVGMVRGGISVAVPLSPFVAIKKSKFITFSLIDCLIWVVGLVAILASMFFMNKQVRYSRKAKVRLAENKKLHKMVDMSEAACKELDKPLQTISDNTELIIMSLESGNPAYNKVVKIKRQVNQINEITKKIKDRKYLITEKNLG